MSESFNKDEIRRKVIGLGEHSFQKSYYPQLQEQINELNRQKELLEKTNFDLKQTLNALQETQESLLSNKKKYHILFENANDAIFIINSTDKSIIDCNAHAVKLLNYNNKAELLSKSVLDISTKYQKNRQASSELAPKVFSDALKGTPQRLDWILQKRNSTIIYCVVSLNKIQSLGENMVQAIVRDVTKERQIEREMSMATIRSVEKERLRFAKELHDGIGPILSTIKLYIEWLKEDNQNKENELILDKAIYGITEATKSIKEIAYNLSPHILEKYGLVVAVNQLIENILVTNKLQIDFSSNLKTRLNVDAEISLYRTIAELINNTLKYAKATRVNIKVNNNNNALSFNYSDNGIGFDLNKLDTKSKGMGLFNIKNRIEKIGGETQIISEKGSGMQFNAFFTN